MKAYYNEHDPKAAAWLRELMRVGAIMDGVVDERSIAEVRPADLVGFARVHFFAGIGGWDYALKLAGWGDRPVWTGSCPCQPFSAAGKRKGVADERHLWPEFFRLIRECRPECVFGEQVSGALGWLDLVSADLEGEGYACGAVIVGAHSVGAPHIRQRLYWVAHPDAGHAERGSSHRPGVCGSEAGEGPDHHAGGRGEAGGVADAQAARWGTGRAGEAGDGGDAARLEPAGLRDAVGLADAERGSAERRGHDVAAAAGRDQGEARERERIRDDAGTGGDVDWLADAVLAGRAEGRAVAGGGPAAGGGESGGVADPERQRGRGGEPWSADAGDAGQPGQAGFWDALEWLPCRDGKARPTRQGIHPLVRSAESRVQPMDDGTPGRLVRRGDSGAPINPNDSPEGRIMRLRGYGNAINVYTAAAFIEAYRDARGE